MRPSKSRMTSIKALPKLDKTRVMEMTKKNWLDVLQVITFKNDFKYCLRNNSPNNLEKTELASEQGDSSKKFNQLASWLYKSENTMHFFCPWKPWFSTETTRKAIGDSNLFPIVSGNQPPLRESGGVHDVRGHDDAFEDELGNVVGNIDSPPHWVWYPTLSSSYSISENKVSTAKTWVGISTDHEQMLIEVLAITYTPTLPLESKCVIAKTNIKTLSELFLEAGRKRGLVSSSKGKIKWTCLKEKRFINVADNVILKSIVVVPEAISMASLCPDPQETFGVT
ncbi:hypothetical protein V6N11_053633 [Hibiscus sabdariffa]|uniref:Uncharacterized protein n=1 Tax=Hibiscus sabdariffa TaxID=183260 RepID=A0ABR2N756_9ROSI